MSKNKQFHLLLTEAQFDRISRAAKIRGLSKASVVRDFTIQGLIDWEREYRDQVKREEHCHERAS